MAHLRKARLRGFVNTSRRPSFTVVEEMIEVPISSRSRRCASTLDLGRDRRVAILAAGTSPTSDVEKLWECSSLNFMEGGIPGPHDWEQVFAFPGDASWDLSRCVPLETCATTPCRRQCRLLCRRSCLKTVTLVPQDVAERVTPEEEHWRPLPDTFSDSIPNPRSEVMFALKSFILQRLARRVKTPTTQRSHTSTSRALHSTSFAPQRFPHLGAAPEIDCKKTRPTQESAHPAMPLSPRAHIPTIHLSSACCLQSLLPFKGRNAAS